MWDCGPHCGFGAKKSVAEVAGDFYLIIIIMIISEASSRDPFAFSTLRQPRCIKLMALVCLMVTL